MTELGARTLLWLSEGAGGREEDPREAGIASEGLRVRKSSVRDLAVDPCTSGCFSSDQAAPSPCCPLGSFLAGYWLASK